MSGSSFVDTLELASDDRLFALRPDLDIPGRRDLVLRGGSGGEPQAPEAIGPDLRAAVNAGSLISFVAGLTETEMSDVLFSTQIAQRAASAKHDRFAETEAWYKLYADVLEQLGWVGEAFAFTHRSKDAGSFTMEKSALDLILTVATGNQLAILVKTISTLKGLADSSGTLRVFEMQALTELSGNFQIGAVQRAENGALSLALGAFYFRTGNAKRQVLFVSWGADEIDFWMGAQKLTLNNALYAQHRASVMARLSADASAYIAALEIV